MAGVIRELAENANTYQPLDEGEERLVDPRFVVWLGPGVNDPHWTVVQRLRLGDDVPAVVEEIRELLRERGRTSCTWEVADSATPSDLVARLLALGLVRDDEPVATGMVLRTPPAAPPPGVTARQVESAGEAETAARIAGVAFSMPAEVVEQTAALARRAFERGNGHGITYLAFADGVPVARATASFLPDATLLFGGATLPEGRGRGAYRALVRARWDDAVARRTPALVTHAGAMSRPILERLGFEPVSRLDILVDRRVGL